MPELRARVHAELAHAQVLHGRVLGGMEEEAPEDGETGEETRMRTMEFGGDVIAYYDEEDLAECRVCHVRPTYKDGTSSGGGSYVRCPSCGIKTGTSTSGLEGVLPVWNRCMVDNWQDPKEALE